MYDIVALEKQWVKGLSVRTTNEIEKTKERKIAPLWQDFAQTATWGKLQS